MDRKTAKLSGLVYGVLYADKNCYFAVQARKYQKIMAMRVLNTWIKAIEGRISERSERMAEKSKPRGWPGGGNTRERRKAANRAYKPF
jgi:hypothetical protein